MAGGFKDGAGGPCNCLSHGKNVSAVQTTARFLTLPHTSSHPTRRFGTVGPDVRCVPSLVGPSLSSAQWPCRPASCAPGTASTVNGTASAGGAAGEVLTFTNAPQTLVCPSSANGTALAGSSGCPFNVTEVCDTLQCPASGCSATGGDCLDGACVCRFGFMGATCANALVNDVLPQLGYAAFAPPPPPLAAGPGARPAGVAAMLGATLLAVLLPLVVLV